MDVPFEKAPVTEHEVIEAIETPVEQTEPLGALIRRLSDIAPRRYRVLSCYLRLEPGDRFRTAYLVELKDRVKAVKADPVMLTLERDERLAVERDLERIEARVERPANLPHTSGLAIFACEELALFAVVPLRRVHRTRLVLDDTPWIRELVAAERESESMLTVLVDRTHARFFEVTVGEAVELPSVITPAGRGGKFFPDREDAPGVGEKRYHQRIEEERHRHYADIVAELERLAAQRPVRGIVIAGPQDHTAALTRFLPTDLAQRLLGTAALNPTALSPSEVQAASFRVAEEHDRAATAVLVASMEHSVGTGWAVNGARETLAALGRGQVRTLLIREDLEGAGFRCRDTGRLVLAKGDCAGEGAPEPVRDLVDEAVEEALRQRIQVVVIRDPDVAAAVDGLAAFLRFIR
ncbi:MAG TPA: VLRF1 family aeRF1-type release factor [Gemmatimonadales bacterium]|jgi:peptide chain release factor subunit 1